MFLIVRVNHYTLGFALAGIVLAVAQFLVHVNPLNSCMGYAKLPPRAVIHRSSGAWCWRSVCNAIPFHRRLRSSRCSRCKRTSPAVTHQFKLSAHQARTLVCIPKAGLLGGAIFAFAFAGARKLKTDTVARISPLVWLLSAAHLLRA